MVDRSRYVISKYMVSSINASDDYVDITEIDDVKIILLRKMFHACENVHFLFSSSFLQQRMLFYMRWNNNKSRF